MATFEEYLAQLQGNPEDDKRAAQSQALMLMGAGLLGGGPDRGRNISQAITGGLLGYNQGMKGALEQRRQKMEMENEARKLADYDRQQSALQGLPSGVPQMPSGMTGGPTPDNAAAMPPKAAPWQLAQQRGDYLAQKGLLTQAKIYYDQAEKFRPEVKDRYTAKDPNTGEVVDVILYKDGTQEVAKNKNATKMEFRDLGGTQAGIDPFSGRVQSSYGKTQSPDSVASNALTMRGQNMTDARAREGLQQGKVPAGYEVNPAGGLMPIKGGPADPSQKQQQPASETELTAAGYASRMNRADKIISQLPDTAVPNFAQTVANNRFPISAPYLSGEDRQKFRQAQEDWVRAKLRKESGAVIADEEMAREIRVYFPQPGDSEGVKAQKADARRQANESMLTAAGKARSQVTGGSSGWSIKKVD